MIIGTGTDLVHIPRMAQTFEKQGMRFLNRCFSDAEIEYALAAKDPGMRAARLAKRWAAKEAFGKALGTGIAEGIRLRDISVLHGANSRPFLTVTGGAKDMLEKIAQHGTPDIHLSLADDGEYAQAFVVLFAEKD